MRYTTTVRIALVTGSAGDEQCGVGDYAYELAQHLALDGEVDLFFDRGHSPKLPPHERLTTLKLVPLGGFSVFMIKGLAERLSAGGYDIIHLQYPSKGYGTSVGPAFLPQRLAGMQSRSRIVLTLHEWHTSHPLRKIVMDQMLPNIDALVLSNEAEMQGLVSKLPGKPVMVMPVGNVLRSRAELDAVWLAAEGKAVPQLTAPAGLKGRVPCGIFHYGLPAKGKGFERLLEALQLVRQAGCPATLYLGGDFPPGNKLTEDLLNAITEAGLAEAVVRLGHIPRALLESTAQQYVLGVFPFDEGYSSKRSSIASISHCDLPLVVGGGSAEEHPYYAPSQNTGAALGVLLLELLTGRLEQEWAQQVTRQREYAQRFSFAKLAEAHLALYKRMRRVDI
jgi:hypothetical protein